MCTFVSIFIIINSLFYAKAVLVRIAVSFGKILKKYNSLVLSGQMLYSGPIL